MMGGAERSQGEPTGISETSPLVASEQEQLHREVRFLARHDNARAVGVLTTSDLRFITRVYPAVAKEMLGIYRQETTPTITPIAQEDYIAEYLAAALSYGDLVTDEQVAAIRQRVQKGDYSQQIGSFVKHQQDEKQQDSKSRRGFFDVEDDEDDEDDYEYGQLGRSQNSDQLGNISDKKGGVLSLKLGLEVSIEALYGETDYKNALLTELLLQAPFIDSVMTADPETISDEARERQFAYLDEIRKFVEEFDPNSRFQAFEEATQRHTASLIIESKPPTINDFDRNYLKAVYEFAKRVRSGDATPANLHELFQQTLFRRGTHFVVTATRDGLRMEPKRPEQVSFDDVVGYERQVSYFKTLLRRTAEGHRSMNNVRLILLASKPGLGKTLTVNAFLNELPENARGLMFDHKKSVRRRDITSVLGEFAELARLHPDLHIFAGIEDINTNEYLEDELLEIESIIPGTFPPNLHLIATTNYPQRIPEPLLRPGRTSEILIYEPPQKSSDRQGIIALHARKQEVKLNPRAVSTIAGRIGGFTPDELAHVVRTISLECGDNPTSSEIDRVIAKMKERRDLPKKLRNFN